MIWNVNGLSEAVPMILGRRKLKKSGLGVNFGRSRAVLPEIRPGAYVISSFAMRYWGMGIQKFTVDTLIGLK